jgi:hypothetical protein
MCFPKAPGHPPDGGYPSRWASGRHPIVWIGVLLLALGTDVAVGQARGPLLMGARHFFRTKWMGPPDASGVGPLVNFEGNAAFCSQMMECHRGGVDLIQIGRIWKALGLVEEIGDPRTGM